MNKNNQKNRVRLQGFYAHALELHEQKKFMEAVVLYQKILNQIPDADLINYNLGLALYELAEYRQSMAAFALAVRYNPDDPDYWFNFGLAARQHGEYDIAEDAYKKALALQPDNSDTFYNLGCCYRAAGEIKKARAAFEKTISLEKDHAPALSNLACCLHLGGNYEQAAVIYLRLLELRPGDEAAIYMLAALKGDGPTSPPPGYVSQLFDGYSADFEHDLLENLNYRVPELLREMIAEVIGSGDNKKNMLDLGCGTGLAGLALADFVRTMTGVDLSEKMIAKARAKGCYDILVVGDVVEFMKTMAQPVDLLVAADVLTYLGDLEPLFQAAGNCLIRGGIFCFSTEQSEKTDYQLYKTGRYGHHPDYIHGLAHLAGFAILKRKKEKIRRERNKWITGNIYLLLREDNALLVKKIVPKTRSF